MSKIPSCVYGYKLPRDTQQAIHAAIIADICCYDLESRQDIQRLGGPEPERDIFWTVGEVPEHIDDHPSPGYTITTGMILLAKHGAELHTEGTTFRLFPGTIFRIDHSKKHRVYVDDLDAPFAFLAWDHPRRGIVPMRELAMEMAQDLGRRTARFLTDPGKQELELWKSIKLEDYRDAPYPIDFKINL